MLVGVDIEPTAAQGINATEPCRVRCANENCTYFALSIDDATVVRGDRTMGEVIGIFCCQGCLSKRMCIGNDGRYNVKGYSKSHYAHCTKTPADPSAPVAIIHRMIPRPQHRIASADDENSVVGSGKSKRSRTVEPERPVAIVKREMIGLPRSCLLYTSPSPRD